MGTEETVHFRINRRRRRSQIWHQWFGLGSLPPHSGAGSGFRIRSGLGLGFRMDTWIRSMGAFYRERILTPGPVHITPSNWK
ncbi:hypothetical protein OYC64_020745 [Pagothenia borchgrevinki]|uniref:Uncharacterized protein n=1 Tax=Pagothenia borchgrevinki TaxID=8213 RepID=A0ABD2FME5_PAGBO